MSVWASVTSVTAVRVPSAVIRSSNATTSVRACTALVFDPSVTNSTWMWPGSGRAA